MTAKNLGLAIMVALFLAAVVHAAVYYPRLPGRMAAHFGGDGRPDDWVARGAVICGYLLVESACVALFVGLGFLVPKLPDRLLSIPNKTYWMAQQRRTDTHRAIAASLYWLANLQMALSIAVMQVVFWANLDQNRNPNTAFFTVLSYYCLAVAAWLGLLLWRFRRRT